MGKRVTFDVFLCRAKEKHQNKYDYTLAKDDYIKIDSKVRIICPIHGETIQEARTHLKGHGCKQCGYDNNSKEFRKSSISFIAEAKDVHNDTYDYSLVEYKTCYDKVRIICPTHGIFEKSPNHHLKGQGCPNCSVKSIDIINNNRHRNIKANFIKKARNVHGDSFEYLSEYVDSYTKINIKCNKCGLLFKQKPHNHLSGNGCPHCKISKGEKRIRVWLDNNNVEYYTEKWWDECRGKVRPLPFDFWLPNKNMVIEFQGRQHYEPVNFRNSLNEEEIRNNFESTKRNDSIKKEFCINTNITLLEIPYWEMKNIEEILNKNIGE